MGIDIITDLKNIKMRINNCRNIWWFQEKNVSLQREKKRMHR